MCNCQHTLSKQTSDTLRTNDKQTSNEIQTTSQQASNTLQSNMANMSVNCSAQHFKPTANKLKTNSVWSVVGVGSKCVWKSVRSLLEMLFEVCSEFVWSVARHLPGLTILSWEVFEMCSKVVWICLFEVRLELYFEFVWSMRPYSNRFQIKSVWSVLEVSSKLFEVRLACVWSAFEVW